MNLNILKPIAWILMICLLVITSQNQATSQSSFFNRTHPFTQNIDRFDVIYHLDHNIHLAYKRIAREDILNSSNTLDTASITPLDRHDIQKIKRAQEDFDNYRNNKGILKYFYKDPAHLLQVQTESFSLTLNALLNIKLGYESESDEIIFHNGRGIELYGSLDNKLYFYTALMENQSNFFNYQEPFIEEFSTIRGQGNFKTYQSRVINNLSGFDYARATAYFGINVSKHTKLELGHDRHFIGHGMRSLLLGDEGPNYFFLKFDVNVWKIHYQTIFAELSTTSAKFTSGDILLPKKYMATHYFSFKPSKKFELGFFESIVFARENNFELQYLNPIIFYRTVEFQLDSPDNVLLGLNLKWHAAKGVSLYGQIMLDEFSAREIFSSRQWWGNKYGLQGGVKYYNMFGIDHLDIQLEHNRVRPYTFSHRVASEEFPNITVSNFSHSFQPLAHPLGANFTETIVRLRYQITPNWQIEPRLILTKVGRDDEANYGSNLIKPDATRIANFGITQNQGLVSDISMLHVNSSLRLFHGAYLDVDFILRNDLNQSLGDTRTLYFGTGFRYNFSTHHIDY